MSLRPPVFAGSGVCRLGAAALLHWHRRPLLDRLGPMPKLGPVLKGAGMILAASRLTGLPAMLALAAAASLAGSAPARAHAQLDQANPPVGATVSQPPREVTIDFSEAIEPRFSTVHVRDANGQMVDAGSPRSEPGNPKRLVIGLKPLQPGTYKVIWRVTSVDTHKSEGAFNFTVKP